MRPGDDPAVAESRGSYLVHVILYLTVMFLIREVYFPSLGFLFNGLFWSLTTLAVAAGMMRAKGVTWRDLGLRRPSSLQTMVMATISTLVLAIGSILVFELVKEQVQLGLAPDESNASAVRKFGDLRGSWTRFFAIIPLIWMESFLEEVLDRGFLLNWIERLFSRAAFATVLAVVLQALIFGFRHSYDLSERSITVGLIGLAMGVGYVAFGRNLWPLIIVHCLLNTLSMMERVG